MFLSSRHSMLVLESKYIIWVQYRQCIVLISMLCMVYMCCPFVWCGSGSALGERVGIWAACIISWLDFDLIFCSTCIALAISVTCTAGVSVLSPFLCWRYHFHIPSSDGGVFVFFRILGRIRPRFRASFFAILLQSNQHTTEVEELSTRWIFGTRLFQTADISYIVKIDIAQHGV